MSVPISGEQLSISEQRSVLDSMPGLYSQTLRSGILLPGLPSTVGLINVLTNDTLDAKITLGSGLFSMAMFSNLFGSRSRGRMYNAITQHEALQATYQQPIDVVGNKVRWYGFDKSMHDVRYDQLTAVEEFGHLVNNIDPINDPKLYVSETVLSKLPVDTAETYIDTMRLTDFTLHKRVTDPVADGVVLALDIPTAKRLHIDLSEQVARVDAVPIALELLARVDPMHRAVLAHENGEGLSRIKSEIRTKIEDRLSEVGQIERMNGTRQMHSAYLHGAYVQHIYTNTSKKPVESRPAEPLIGEQTFPQLLKTVRDTLANGKVMPVETVEELVWTAFQVTEELDKSTLGSLTANTAATRASLQSRVIAHPPRYIPWLRSHGRGDNAGNEVIYHNPARKRVAKWAAGIALASALVPPAGLLITDAVHGLGGSSPGHNVVSTSTMISDTVGDAGGNPDTPVWQLHATNGVSTAGYWSESVQDQFTEIDSNLDAGTPPYRNEALQFNHQYREINSADTVVATSVGDIPAGTPGIDVTGNVDFFLDGTPVYSAPNNMGDSSPTNVAISIPVRQGMKLAGVTLSLPGDTAVRLPLGQPTTLNKLLDVKTMTGSDGTTAVYIKNYRYLGNQQIKLEYFIEPDSFNASSRPAKAIRPTQNDQTKVAEDQSLANLISSEQAQAMYEKLPGAPKAYVDDLSATQLASIISKAHIYSRNPYKDSGVKSTMLAESDPTTTASVSQFLNTVGDTAAAMRYAICNDSTAQEFLMTRGITNKEGMIDPVVGFLNSEANSKALTTGGAHTWLTDQTGDIIDPTSAAANHTPMTLKQKTEIYSEVLGVGLGFLAITSFGGYAALKGSRRRKQKYLFPKTVEAQAQRHQQVNIVNSILYGQGRTITGTNLTNEARRKSLAERYASLQKRGVTTKDLNKAITRRQLKHELPAGHSRRELRRIIKALS